MLTERRLAEIANRLERMIRVEPCSPWHFEEEAHDLLVRGPEWSDFIVYCGFHITPTRARYVQARRIFQFIAGSRQDIPDLLAEVRQLRTKAAIDDALMDQASTLMAELRRERDRLLLEMRC